MFRLEEQEQEQDHQVVRRESIEEHRATRDPNQPRDFLDVYLAEVEAGTKPNFDQESLELTCLDLFKAGAETSSTTLLWCVLYLTCHQVSHPPEPV